MQALHDNPDHHLWNNNGTYYLAITLLGPDHRTMRIRSSLKTRNLRQARVRRDAVLDLLVLLSLDPDPCIPDPVDRADRSTGSRPPHRTGTALTGRHA